MFISLCLFAVFAVGFTVQAYAKESVRTAEYISIEPLWSHTISIAAGLEINNGRATMAGSVIGRSGTESISVNARLDRINANGTITNIGSWNNLNTTGNTWSWERVHYVARGHDYRLTLTATVFRNGESETVSMSRTTRAN